MSSLSPLLLRTHAPAALLFERQIVPGQEGGEPFPFSRRISAAAHDMPRRQGYATMPQQGNQAAPMQPVTGLAAQPDRR